MLERKVGRPSQEVMDAQVVLAAFEALVRQAVPAIRGRSEDEMRPIGDARDLSTQVLDQLNDQSSKLISDAISQNSTD